MPRQKPVLPAFTVEVNLPAKREIEIPWRRYSRPITTWADSEVHTRTIHLCRELGIEYGPQHRAWQRAFCDKLEDLYQQLAKDAP